ncbi:MAG: hypothetical protein JWO90_1195 [Solirubrobacterales bacterium]|jgi:hypothetical protein|nr:hypothetical protein [Solirubrobacterales bacterium]
MDGFDDVARFRADDDPQLVAASFACPVCLGLDGVARLLIERDDSEVECACVGCGTAWTVAVDPAQVMRLVLHPPTAEETRLRLLTPRMADAPWSQHRRAA